MLVSSHRSARRDARWGGRVPYRLPHLPTRLRRRGPACVVPSCAVAVLVRAICRCRTGYHPLRAMRAGLAPARRPPSAVKIPAHSHTGPSGLWLARLTAIPECRSAIGYPCWCPATDRHGGMRAGAVEFRTGFPIFQPVLRRRGPVVPPSVPSCAVGACWFGPFAAAGRVITRYGRCEAGWPQRAGRRPL